MSSLERLISRAERKREIIRAVIDVINAISAAFRYPIKSRNTHAVQKKKLIAAMNCMFLIMVILF